MDVLSAVLVSSYVFGSCVLEQSREDGLITFFISLIEYCLFARVYAHH